MKNVENDLRDISNKKFDEASEVLNVIGSNPIFISIKNGLVVKWVDTKDLKSFGQKCPCRFESDRGYEYISYNI